jgi:bacteriocin-like protein
MNTVEVRELNNDELETVSGGYKFCWDGPAGTGTYPDYANCGDGQTMNDIIDGIVTNVRNIVYGPGK